MTHGSRDRWRELTELLDRADRNGLGVLTSTDIKRLCRLYRQVTIDLSRARADAGDFDLSRYLNTLAARAHGRVYRAKRVAVTPLLGFIVVGFPRLVRRHARPILAATSVFLLSSLFSFMAVVLQPDLAYSLFEERIVEYENLRLEKQAGEYRGNFTFDVEESPLVAVQIIGNNVRVAALAFALGALCCLPGVLLLIYNGRMLGTLMGLVWNAGYLMDFCSLILTHGVLELSAICISGGAGFMLGWAVIAPGRLSRKEALQRTALDAIGLLGGAAVLLVVAGVIEAYITPHFGQPVRWGVALGSGALLLAYIVLCGGVPSSQQPAEGNRQVFV